MRARCRRLLGSHVETLALQNKDIPVLQHVELSAWLTTTAIATAARGNSTPSYDACSSPDASIATSTQLPHTTISVNLPAHSQHGRLMQRVMPYSPYVTYPISQAPSPQPQAPSSITASHVSEASQRGESRHSLTPPTGSCNCTAAPADGPQGALRQHLPYGPYSPRLPYTRRRHSCASAEQRRLIMYNAAGERNGSDGTMAAGRASGNTATGSRHSSSRGSGSANDRGDGGSGSGNRNTNGGSDSGSGSGNGGSGSGSPGRVLPLRSALRLLYKKVHPDLFHDKPKAKEENERSFKLLQEYVQLARSGDVRSPAARLPYRFVFYLRQPPENVEAATAAGGAAAAAAAASSPPPSPAMPPLRPRPGTSPSRGHPHPPSTSPTASGAAAAVSPDPTNSESATSPSSPAAAAGGGHASSDADLPGLHVVRVTLPPPAISAPGAQELSGPTRKALAKLLAACGLATSGREGSGDAEEEQGQGGPMSLAAFLPEVVEALRQAEAAHGSSPAVRVANLRGALRLRRQVMVSFSDKQLPPRRQVELLERLVTVVDAEQGLSLAGCHIVLGDRMGLDRLGHLCLAASESNDAWTDFLTGVDIDFVLQQRKSVQALRQLEAQVSQAAGVAQIFTPYGNLMDPSYRAFLEAVAAAAASRGPLGGGALREVSLCVVPPASPEQQQEQQCSGDMEAAAACCLDATSPGVLQVASDAAVDRLYESATQLGPEALRALRWERHVEGQLRELSDKTRQRLRLRTLTRDPRVTPEDFRAACNLLLSQVAALMPLLEGCSLRVGFANRLAPDGSCIEIAHNCEL